MSGVGLGVIPSKLPEDEELEGEDAKSLHSADPTGATRRDIESSDANEDATKKAQEQAAEE